MASDKSAGKQTLSAMIVLWLFGRDRPTERSGLIQWKKNNLLALPALTLSGRKRKKNLKGSEFAALQFSCRSRCQQMASFPSW